MKKVQAVLNWGSDCISSLSLPPCINQSWGIQLFFTIFLGICIPIFPNDDDEEKHGIDTEVSTVRVIYCFLITR